jgi:hypothetical protein
MNQGEARLAPPALPTERIAHPRWQETAALRDFNPAHDRCGSYADIRERSTVSPLYPNKRTSNVAVGMSA